MLMQTMNRRLIFFCILFFCSIQSCDFRAKINSTGKALEIILIQGEKCSDSDFLLFQKNLIAPQVPLLETELYGEKKNFFHVIPILEKEFNNIFKTHKNIIFLNNSESFSIQKKEDLWAVNQIVYFCSLKKNSKEQVIKLAESVAVKIKEREITKRKNQYTQTTPQHIQNYIDSKFKLNLSIPNFFFIADSLENTLYLRGETKKSSQIILISSFALEPTVENIILEQNRVAKNNISSDIEGSFVRIEERTKLYIDSLTRTNDTKINIKGLWKMEGDFMGGSFFTTLIMNPKNQQKTLVSFYLYAPGENKANYLLDLEAMLRGVSFVNN